MSKTDEMFEKLGYEKKEHFDTEVELYYEDHNGYIIFYKDNYVGLETNDEDCIYAMNIQELQAINEKVKELGWK